MRIDGTNNFMAAHVARAYGVPQNRAAAPPASASPIGRVGPAAESTTIGATSAPGRSLIAGTVRGPIEFDGVSVPRSNPAALNLYTRAADKIEAATAVHIGRTIDIKG